MTDVSKYEIGPLDEDRLSSFGRMMAQQFTEETHGGGKAAANNAVRRDKEARELEEEGFIEQGEG